MREKARVSVIVPSYNYGHFLGRTLDSVQAQTTPNWECIVVDDGSTDNTWEVAQSMAQVDSRFRYVRKSNGGLAAARNTGLAAATCEYVQFLDADDLIEPRKLELQTAWLDTHARDGIVYGGVRYFENDTPGVLRYTPSGPDGPWIPEVSGSGESVLRTLLLGNIMAVNAPLVRRSVIDRAGGFDERMRCLEDWELWIRCAAAGTIFRYHDPEGTLALVRVHNRSMSQDRVGMLQQHVSMRKRIGPNIVGERLYRLSRWTLADELEMLGREHRKKGARLEALLCDLEATLLDPGPRSRRWIGEQVEALRARMRRSGERTSH